jgi:hypothetical protein
MTMITLNCGCGAGADVDVEMRPGETVDDVRRDLRMTCPACKPTPLGRPPMRQNGLAARGGAEEPSNPPRLVPGPARGVLEDEG